MRERGIERENTFGFLGFLAIAGVQASGFLWVWIALKIEHPSCCPWVGVASVSLNGGETCCCCAVRCGCR